MPSDGEINLNNARDEQDDAREQFRITFDANPAPSAIIRLSDAVVVKANSGLPELTGWDNREIEGRSVYDLELFASTEEIERIVAALNQGESTVKAEISIHSATNGVHDTLMSAKPIKLGADACGIFTFADVTELRRAQELFVQVFRLTPVPVAIVAADNRFADVNRSFEELTGYAHSEVVGHSSAELAMWSSRADQKRLQDALREQGEFRDVELDIRTKAGEVRHILGSGKRLRVRGEEILLHIFYDVTARKQDEEEMHQAIQEVMTDAGWFSHQLLERLANIRSRGVGKAETVKLSERERQVLARMARGVNNDAIAAEFGLKTQTVRNYITTIYEKLGVHSRVEAVVWARERGVGA